MAARDDCLHATGLSDLLTGSLTPERETELRDHVETCAVCQRELERLVHESEDDRLADHLRQGSPQAESALLAVMDRLNGSSNNAAQPAEQAASPVTLEFLAPSDNPQHLGRLGPYEITDFVGQGGMGVVLKALDAKLNRVVAIKVLMPALASNATARKRFLREAVAAAAVTHQHVVTIHAVDEGQSPTGAAAPEGRVPIPPYLVMEYVDGVSLQQKIDREGHLELKEILRIGSQIASGLAAAHAQGLIHRDIKPSNILLENGVERVRVTDFGLARAVDDVTITGTGEVTGTPQYMSPEQAQGLKVDARSDLFSLGCVLYAMCTGRSPFRADTTIAAIRRVCDESPRPVREINADVPDWLAEIIERLLAKRPDDRFQSAGEVAELLGRHLAHVQDPGSAPRPEPGKWKRLRPGRPRRRWLGAVPALLLVVIALGLLEAAGVINVLGTSEPTLTIDPPTGGESVPENSETTVSGAGSQREVDLPAVISEVRRFEGHTRSVKQVAVSRDGTLALSGSGLLGDRSVRLWEVATGRQIRSLDTSGENILTVCFSHDGERAAAAGFGGVVYLWDVATGRQITTLQTNTEVVDDLAFSPDGRHLLCATHKRRIVMKLQDVLDQGTAQLWDLETEELVWDWDAKGWLTTADFLRDGERVAVAGWYTGPAVHLLDRQSGDELQRLENVGEGGDQIEELAVSHDGQYVATASEFGYVCLWDLEAGARPIKYRSNMGNLRSVAFSPDNRRLVCGSGEGTAGSIQLLEVPSLEIVATVEHPGGIAWHVAYLPDGWHVLSAGGWSEEEPGDYALRLWRLPEAAPSPDEDSTSIEKQIAELTTRIEKSPDDAAARIERAHLFTRLRRWREAADDLKTAKDDVFNKPGDAFLHAILLVHLGDDAGHQKVCTRMMERFGNTTDVWTANCLVKSCLLRPGVIEPARLPVKFVSADREFTTEKPPWVLREARALIAYRKGDFDECRRQVRETMALPAYKEDPLYAPRALSLLAMANHKVGDPKLARDLYEEATRKFEQIDLPTGHAGMIGWLYAKLYLREAAELIGVEKPGAAERREPGAFVVLSDRGSEREFATLADAVDASSAGDTIEIRGDEPYPADYVPVRHPLIIRAASGAQPVIESPVEGGGVFRVDAPLVLENLTIRRPSPSGPTADSKWSPTIHAKGGFRIRAANCRFVNHHGPFVYARGLEPAGESHTAVFRNCELISWLPAPGAAWGLLAAEDVKWSFENCVHTSFVHLENHRPEGNRLHLTLVRSTMSSACLLVDIPDMSQTDGQSPASLIQVDAAQNIFGSTRGMAVRLYQLPGSWRPQRADIVEQAAQLLIRWRDRDNVYIPDSLHILTQAADWSALESPLGQDLTAWNNFWGLEDTGSIVGPVRLSGGDVPKRSTQADFDKLTAEDFRLLPDSAGYRAGPDGKDLGADIDLVGPGEAYERWKKTPEYQNWREETEQLIAASRPAEAAKQKHDNSGGAGPVAAPKPRTNN